MSCSAVEGADGIDLSEVGAGQAEEGRADLKARVVVPGFARAPWGGERVRRGRLAFGEGREVRVDRGVAGVDLALEELVGLEVLLQREQVLGAVVPGEGRGDHVGGGPAAVVTMGGQRVGIAHAGENVAHDPLAGDAGEIGDHGVELEVHLHERLLHALDVGGGAVHQGLAVAQIGS